MNAMGNGASAIKKGEALLHAGKVEEALALVTSVMQGAEGGGGSEMSPCSSSAPSA